MRIRTAFKKSDGSLNLRFDYLPTDLGATTIQVRERRNDTAAEASHGQAEA
jgi:hypothetical protein